MSVWRSAAAVLGGCLVLAGSGCGGPVTVTGRVTLDGQPVENAQVFFRPLDGGPGAGAVTDAEGRFRLEGTKADGLLPGEYKVTVSKKAYPPGMKVPGPNEMSFALSAKMIEVLPKRYTVPDRTPLRVTVPTGGAKAIEIALQKDGG
jgi:hypothetical protein